MATRDHRDRAAHGRPVARDPADRHAGRYARSPRRCLPAPRGSHRECADGQLRRRVWMRRPSHEYAAAPHAVVIRAPAGKSPQSPGGGADAGKHRHHRSGSHILGAAAHPPRRGASRWRPAQASATARRAVPGPGRAGRGTHGAASRRQRTDRSARDAAQRPKSNSRTRPPTCQHPLPRITPSRSDGTSGTGRRRCRPTSESSGSTPRSSCSRPTT